MTFTERLMGVGAWNVTLVPDTPRSVLRRLIVDRPGVGFGHVAVTNTPVDLTLGDSILSLARFTGVYRSSSSELELSGPGLAVWIGDEDGKGPSYPGRFGDLVDGTFAGWIAAIRPAALTAGFVSSIPGTMFKWFHRTGLRKPLDVVCETFSAEWRVNPNFSFDAGYPADLFRMDPSTIFMGRKGEGGRDYNVRGIVADLQVERDLEDWIERAVHFLGTEEDPVVGTSDGGVPAADVPYRRPDGAPVNMDLLTEEFGTLPDGTSPTDALAAANAEAAKDFDKFRGSRRALTASAVGYDIGSDLRVGDNVWVFDPLRGIYDLTNPVPYRGGVVYPETVRCVGMSSKIRRGMGVYFRSFVKAGSVWSVKWTDLTNFVDWESGDTTVELGAKPRTS